MDTLPTKIMQHLFGVEKDAPVRAPRNPELENAVDHWTTPVLLERAAYLRKLAKCGNGSAIESLKEYPQHRAMLSFRARSSEAEVYERFAQMLFVLDGTATLISGGTLARPARTGPDEIRGACTEGGIPGQLRAGDVAHIPAGQAHQFLLSGGRTLTCLVLRIQETA